jgi:hypothetical protein
MRLLKRVFHFYLESSIHVSLAVCAFALMSFFTFQKPVDIRFIVFLFLGTITGYNFVKYASLAGFHHRSLTRNLKAIQVFSLLIFLGFLYTSYFMPWGVILGSLVLGLFTLFYIVPFLKSYNLRSLSGLKIFVVAFVWAGVTVLLPWLLTSEIRTLDFWIVYVQRFLWVLVLTLPFEIRDLVYDQSHLGTIPQRLGIKKTRLLGIVLLVVIIILEGLKESNEWKEVFVLYAMLSITGGFLVISEKDQSQYFASFWVESLPIFWCVFYMVL